MQPDGVVVAVVEKAGAVVGSWTGSTQKLNCRHKKTSLTLDSLLHHFKIC
jgi:hypothetical protein